MNILTKFKNIPCKCGFMHGPEDKTWERFDLKMTTDDLPNQVPLRPVKRCKTCKEILLVKRI